MPLFVASRKTSNTSLIRCSWPRKYTISILIQRVPAQTSSHAMDPVTVLSVLCAAAQLSKALATGVKEVSIFVHQAKNVDSTLQGLLVELRSSSQTVQTIETALSSPLMQTSDIAHDDYGDLWISLDRSIKDCYGVAKALEKAIGTTKLKKQNFWARSIRQLKLNLNAEDIAKLRLQFQTYRTTLSMALETINLIATIIAPNRVIETLGAKIDILALTMTTSLSQHSPKLNRSMSNTDTLVGFSKNTIPENDSSDNPPPYLNTAARNEALREAAKTGDVATLSSLIAQGVNINQRDASGATALHYATSCGHDEAVAVLLACVNVNVNAANEEGYSPLHLACRRGYHQIVGILLTSEKINVDLQNNMQETALHHAAYHGFSGCVKELLGSANTCLLNNSGEMALHLASYHGHTNCVRLLLSSKDAQADGRNAWQESALHLAVANGKIATAEVLMVHCAPDSKDGEGKTPLHLAVMKKHEEIVKLLLRNASPDCVNAYGQSPRDMARFGGSASMMHLFNAGNDGVKVASMVEVLDITAEVY